MGGKNSKDYLCLDLRLLITKYSILQRVVANPVSYKALCACKHDLLNPLRCFAKILIINENEKLRI